MTTRLQLLRDIALDASELAQTWFENRQELLVVAKTPGEWVSDADKAVQKYIEMRIHDALPDDMVLGEEGIEDYEFSKLARPCWIIDPIDGTSNFINGNPLWGVSIGIVSNGIPILGAIILPAMKLGLIGGKNYGVHDLSGQVFDRIEPRVNTIAVGWNINLSMAEEQSLLNRVRFQGFQTVSYRCGTVGQLFAIMGKVNGYVEDYTNYWDIAAGWALAEAAGLDVRGTIEGTPGNQRIEISSPAEKVKPFAALHS